MEEAEIAFKQHYPAFDTTSFLDEYLVALGLQSAGAIRISLGLASNFADVSGFVQFAQAFLDTYPSGQDLPSRMHC